MSVSKKVLKTHEFKTIEDYFEYVQLSKINGQNQQVRSLISVMSGLQKLQFIQYVGNKSETSNDLINNVSYWIQVIIEMES